MADKIKSTPRKKKPAIRDKEAIAELISSDKTREVVPVFAAYIARDKQGYKFDLLDEKAQNALGDEMVAWAFKDDSIILNQFPISKHLSPTRFYRIAEKNEYFAHALDLAKHIIATRLEIGWLKDQIDRDYVQKMLPLYNAEYKAIMIERAKAIKAMIESKASGNPLKVVVERFESTPLVPDRSKESDENSVT